MHITNKESSQFLCSNNFDLARNNLDYVSIPDRYIAKLVLLHSRRNKPTFLQKLIYRDFCGLPSDVKFKMIIMTSIGYQTT